MAYAWSQELNDDVWNKEREKEKKREREGKRERGIDSEIESVRKIVCVCVRRGRECKRLCD